MASSYSAQGGGEAERGVGGKLRRQPPPRRPTTPYARPQQSQSHGSHWISKLVDPARRILAGGANRIIPYIFSNSASNNYLQAPEPLNNEPNDSYNEDVHQTADGDQFTFTSNAGATRLTDVVNTTEIAEGSKTVSVFEDYGEAKKSDLTDTDGLSDIEQLMKDKIFSRDEINHLIEILNSRAVGASKVNLESKEPSRFTGGGCVVSHQYPRKLAEEKQEDFSKSLRELSTPLHLPTRNDEVGASPIDIARAYMENRSSEASLVSRNLVSDDRRHPLRGADFALKPYLSPSSSKLAVVEDQHGYITPQRSRFGLRSLPRTPYTRPIFSESKSKLTPRQADANGSLYNSRTPLQQSWTPLFRQSRGKAVDDGHGSVGPIRRVRLNHGSAAETSSRCASSRSSLNSPSQLENSSVSKGIFSVTKKNLEPRETSQSSLLWLVDGKSRDSEVGPPTVHPHSSQVARTILEHLERKVPTPKDKSDELKLATSWRKSNSSDAAAVLPKERHSLSYFGGFDSKSKDQLDAKASEQRNGDRGNSIPLSLPESTIGTKDAVNRNSSDLSEVSGASVKLFTGKSESSLEFQKTEDSQNRNVLKEVSTNVANAVYSGSLQKPPSNSTGNKRGLLPISVSKPVQSWTFSSENNSGFSFPVSAASGVSSEPPTPSIMPSVSTSAQRQSQQEDSAAPSFSFGSKNSTPLVFSFPSSSSGPNHFESSDIKFSFGSDKSTRISFSSVGKDAVCY